MPVRGKEEGLSTVGQFIKPQEAKVSSAKSGTAALRSVVQGVEAMAPTSTEYDFFKIQFK